MAIVTVRLDENVKKEAEILFKKMDLNMSTAMNLFLKKCILERGIPFELKISNKETRKVLEKVEKGIGLSKIFDSIDKMMENLIRLCLKTRNLCYF
ncbi:type II toxin-antitoxin system RelB/DinJ family antitoxin [Leptotrichia alba]|uniref:Type II toxin-antitoxin system RelB/DinJ family antitoxin n=1 Tax=Leptotrichia alba TaxID=3239304 RepID=A0AB39V657_9FUSO